MVRTLIVASHLVCCLSLAAHSDDAPAASPVQEAPEQTDASPLTATMTVTLETVIARFEAAGYAPDDAFSLACTACGIDPTTIGAPRSGCTYYKVTAFFCDDKTMRTEDYYVGQICMDELLAPCVLQTCPEGERLVFTMMTSSSCTPATSCVSIAIEGPLESTESYICNHIVDCSCWPSFDCAQQSCVKVSKGKKWPTKCPVCP